MTAAPGLFVPFEVSPLEAGVHLHHGYVPAPDVGFGTDDICRAEIFPDEGLDLFLGQAPKNDTRITTFSLCLFTSQTATTVITSAQTVANITETSYTNYARQALATATWGAQAAGTGGRKTTYPQVTFPTVGASGATINGFFIGWDTGAGGVTAPTKAVGQANFDDLAAVPLNTNDVLKLTPAWQVNN